MEDDGIIVSESDADLSSYTQDVKYSLIDCSRAFSKPSKYLDPVNVEIEANNFINVDGLGRHFVAYYQPGV